MNRKNQTLDVTWSAPSSGRSDLESSTKTSALLFFRMYKQVKYLSSRVVLSPPLHVHTFCSQIRFMCFYSLNKLYVDIGLENQQTLLNINLEFSLGTSICTQNRSVCYFLKGKITRYISNDDFSEKQEQDNFNSYPLQACRLLN